MCVWMSASIEEPLYGICICSHGLGHFFEAYNLATNIYLWRLNQAHDPFFFLKFKLIIPKLFLAPFFFRLELFQRCLLLLKLFYCHT